MNVPAAGLNLENSTNLCQRQGALSARYASERRKAEWLALYAEDAVIQDPVGVSPLDPTGLGHRGHEAMSRFWDTVIGPGNMTYRIRESYACGDECANVWTVTNRMPGGIEISVDLVTVYKINAVGKLVSMRAWWSYAAVEKTMTSALAR